MMDHDRRSDDTSIGRFVKLWPVFLSTMILVGTAFVVREDVSRTKTDVTELAMTSRDHEKRLIRVEEAVKAIAEMKDELKQLNSHLLRIANRNER